MLKHSGGDDEYEVRFSVEDDVCIIRVVDTGRGFDSTGLLASEPGAESGRGIEMMRALVDKVKLESRPEDGTVVHLEKRLEFSERSVKKRLEASRSGESGSDRPGG